MPSIPVRVAFRGLPHSDALEAAIQERMAWLEQFYAGIVRCRVLIEVPHRHRQGGRHYHVRVEMTVPGGPAIVVSHDASRHGTLKDIERRAHRKESQVNEMNRDAYIAVHRAFDAARRRLEDFAREQRGAVKTHEVPGASLA